MKDKYKSRYTNSVRRVAKTIIAISLGIIVCAIAATMTGCGTVGRWFGTAYGNQVDYVDQKIDDATNYETIKKVEDTCRAMISSYESDKLTYEQYKDSESEQKQLWGEQAKMRANTTASTYNNYILENSFVWAGNVPEDIKDKLEIIQ